MFGWTAEVKNATFLTSACFVDSK